MNKNKLILSRSWRSTKMQCPRITFQIWSVKRLRLKTYSSVLLRRQNLTSVEERRWSKQSIWLSRKVTIPDCTSCSWDLRSRFSKDSKTWDSWSFVESLHTTKIIKKSRKNKMLGVRDSFLSIFSDKDVKEDTIVHDTRFVGLRLLVMILLLITVLKYWLDEKCIRRHCQKRSFSEWHFRMRVREREREREFARKVSLHFEEGSELIVQHVTVEKKKKVLNIVQSKEKQRFTSNGGHEWPIYNSSIQDQTFLSLFLLVNEKDVEEVFRRTFQTRSKESNFPKTRKELQSLRTIPLEHEIPIRDKGRIRVFSFDLTLDHTLHILKVLTRAFRHNVVETRTSNKCIRKIPQLDSREVRQIVILVGSIDRTRSQKL